MMSLLILKIILEELKSFLLLLGMFFAAVFILHSHSVCCRTDASEDYFETGHSADADKLLTNFIVGKLAESASHSSEVVSPIPEKIVSPKKAPAPKISYYAAPKATNKSIIAAKIVSASAVLVTAFFIIKKFKQQHR